MGARRVLLAALVVVAACGPAHSDPPRTEGLAIRGATLIDGTGRPALPNAVVVIREGRILAAGRADEVEIPDGMAIEEADGRFLLPGLIDVHAHALVPTCQSTSTGTRIAGFDWALSEDLMDMLLRFGITTARSPATPTQLGLAMRDSLASGAVRGPRLLIAGERIDGRQMSPDAVREEVRLQAGQGVDYIKLYSRLRPWAIRTGIEEAHAHGLPVVGHLQATTWSEGVEAGIDQLTHAAPWTEDLLRPDVLPSYRRSRQGATSIRARIDWLEALDPASPEVDSLIGLLVAKDVPLDPTLVAFDTKFSTDASSNRPVALRYRAHPVVKTAPGLVDVWETCGTPTDDWTADDFRRAEAAWPTLLALVRRYYTGGVMLTAGSDTPNAWVIPGVSLHRELELLTDAGIPPLDVIQIATRNGADALDLLEEVGTVEPGKRADLLLLDADPLADITHTQNIVWVMQAGERVWEAE